MRTRSLGFAGALAVGIAASAGAPASAAPAHCFDSFGAPLGPAFDTVYPDYNWIRWVQDRGGSCRALRPEEIAFFRARALDYPPEYLATLRPAAPPSAGVLHSQPPTMETSVWLGDTARAAELLTISFARRGRPTAAVFDTGRVIYRADGVWRVYDVAWSDGHRRQIAVHMRPSREYFAIESDDAEGWSAAVYIGR
jgi:hypothetical protein